MAVRRTCCMSVSAGHSVLPLNFFAIQTRTSATADRRYGWVGVTRITDLVTDISSTPPIILQWSKKE